MNVDEIKKWVEYNLTKDQSGNTMSPSEYNICLKWANNELFKWKYSLPEQYAPGRPLPSQAWSITQENIDALSPFLIGRGGKNHPQLKVDINGQALIPNDYIHHSSIRYNGRPVEVVSNDVIGDRVTSSIVNPTEKYPICSFYESYIQFYPKVLSYVDFDYLRMPVTPIWAYTIINDEAVYNPSGSIQLEWKEQLHPDFANLVLQYATNNLREFNMNQIAQRRKTEGI